MLEKELEDRLFELAPCKGKEELFFRSSGDISKEAKALCAQCVVKVECLEYVLQFRPPLDGYWAGTSKRERIRIMRNRELMDIGEMALR